MQNHDQPRSHGKNPGSRNLSEESEDLWIQSFLPQTIKPWNSRYCSKLCMESQKFMPGIYLILYAVHQEAWRDFTKPYNALRVAASTAARRGWHVRPASAGRCAASERTRAARRARTCVSRRAPALSMSSGPRETSGCPKCRAGFYNDTTQYVEGRCSRCWDRTELALHAGLEQQFFAFFACNTTSNARWRP